MATRMLLDQHGYQIARIDKAGISLVCSEGAIPFFSLCQEGRTPPCRAIHLHYKQGKTLSAFGPTPHTKADEK